MPTTKSMKKKTAASKKRIESPRKTCSVCGKSKALSNYYVSTNMFATDGDGKVGVCKTCIKERVYNIDGSINMERFKEVLMLMDRPFFPETLDICIDEAKKRAANKEDGARLDVVGVYLKNISSLPQYSSTGFIGSLKTAENASNGIAEVENLKTKTNTYTKIIDDFEVTSEVVDRFGIGYDRETYKRMQEKYDKLKLNYQLPTNLHEEALATYVRFKCKEEIATANGNVGEAIQWSKAASDAADKARLSPKQLTSADLTGGVTTISEISKAVEEATDIIEILPRFKYAPNDAPDFIIWCYLNYIRKLKGLPEVEYKDIYEFYDRKKVEYLSQYGDPYGIFTDDTTEANRKNIEKFIQLPKDYYTGG